MKNGFLQENPKNKNKNKSSKNNLKLISKPKTIYFD